MSQMQSGAYQPIIAIFGASGSGKGTLIRKASQTSPSPANSNSKIKGVQETHFKARGVDFTLAEIPGFDNDDPNDNSTFQALADWLRNSYNNNQRLTGILYVHRIDGLRKQASDVRNLRLFKKLCGQGNFANVVIGTTWWDKLDETAASIREGVFRGTPEFWGDMIVRGTHIRRISFQYEKLLDLLGDLVRRPQIVLQIQHEMARMGKSAMDTNAASEFDVANQIQAIKESSSLEITLLQRAHNIREQALVKSAHQQQQERERRLMTMQEEHLKEVAQLVRERLAQQEASERQLELLKVQLESFRSTLEQMELKEEKLKKERSDIALETAELNARLYKQHVLTHMSTHRTRVDADLELFKRHMSTNGPKQRNVSSAKHLKVGDFTADICDSFCDFCGSEISLAQTHRACESCLGDNSALIICQRCYENGLRCFDDTHTLQEGVMNTLDYYRKEHPDLFKCRRYINGTQGGFNCDACTQELSTVFLHCCECDKDDFDLCLDCWGTKGATCKAPETHTLWLHSWASTWHTKRESKRSSVQK